MLYFFIRGYQIPFYSLLGRKNWGTASSYFVEFDDGEPFLVNLVIFKCVPLREYNLKILAIFMFVMHIHDKLRHFNCRIQDQKAKSGWAGNSLFQFIFVFFPLTLIFFFTHSAFCSYPLHTPLLRSFKRVPAWSIQVRMPLFALAAAF